MIAPRFIPLAFVALALPAAVVVAAVAGPATGDLKAPADFARIADKGARSAALFTEMGKVLTHPRCLNCHPRSDSPTQGDAMALHNPPVVRGAAGMGAAGMECSTCHGSANVTYAGGTGSIPGDPAWHLAPASMAWQGLSLAEICRQLKDPARNGGRTLAAIAEHNGKDHLVGWAWNPGRGRTPAPGTQAAFGALTQAWIDSGAQCPA